MKLQFSLSGSIIYEAKVDCIPPVGSDVTFITQNYKKGIKPGTLITTVVADDIPPHYDFSGEDIVVTLDIDSIRSQ